MPIEEIDLDQDDLEALAHAVIRVFQARDTHPAVALLVLSVVTELMKAEFQDEAEAQQIASYATGLVDQVIDLEGSDEASIAASLLGAGKDDGTVH